MITSASIRNARSLATVALWMAAALTLSASSAVGQSFSLDNDGLFNVWAFQETGGGADSQLNSTTETLGIWNAILGGAPVPGTVSANGTTYGIGSYEIDTESVIDYNGGGDFGVNRGYATVNGDGPGGSGGSITGGDDLSVWANTYLAVPVGTWSIAIASDDGRQVSLDGLLGLTNPGFTAIGGQTGLGGVGDDVVGFDGTTGHDQSIGVFTIDPADAVAGTNVALLTLDAFFFERSGGDSFELSFKSGSDTSFGGSGEGWTLLTDGSLMWSISSNPINVTVAGSLGDRTWDGSTGDWTETDADAWDTGLPPASGTDAGDFPTFNAGTTQGHRAYVPSGAVNVTGAQAALNLSVSAPGIVNVQTGASLTVQDTIDTSGGGTLNIDGTLDTYALLGSGGTTNLNDGGQLTLVDGDLGDVSVSGTAGLTSAAVVPVTRVTMDSLSMASGSTLDASGDWTAAAATLGGSGATINQTAGTGQLDAVSGAGGLSKDGDGTVLLTGENTYAGQTTVNGGILLVAHGGALGDTSAGTVVGGGGQLRLDGGITLPGGEAITISGASGGGAIYNLDDTNNIDGLVSLGGNATVRVDDDRLRLRGGVAVGGSTLTANVDGGEFLEIVGNPITGSGSLVKQGDGTLEIRADSPIYSGQITIDNGVVDVGNHSDGLGSTAAPTVVNRGATLRLRDGVTTAEDVSILGIGEGGQGALHSAAGENTLTGTLTMPGTSRIESAAGAKLNLSGPIDLALLGDVTFAGDGDTVVNSPFGNGAAPVMQADALLAQLFTGTTESDIIDIGDGTGSGGVLSRTPDVVDLLTGPMDFRNDFGAGFSALADSWRQDDFSILWEGTFTAPADGDYRLRITDNDDRGRIWIDLDQDGLFEDDAAAGATAGNELVAVNNGGNGTRALAGGQQYRVGFAFHEFAGNEAYEGRLRITGTAGGSGDLAEELVNASDADQAGFWTAQIMPHNGVIKEGAGTTTFNATNTYNGPTTVKGGTLVAAADNALGDPGGDVDVRPGASLALSGGVAVGKNDVTVGGPGAVGMVGALANLDGSNTFDAASLAAPEFFEGEVRIGSAAGQLTVNAAGGLDLRYASLSLGGEGDLVLHADISANSVAVAEPVVSGFLFNGNSTRLPGDPNQLASRLTSDQVWFDNESAFINFWGSDIVGLNNGGNPNDPNNYGNTFVGDLTIVGSGDVDVLFRHTSADDANRIRIDLNQDGDFGDAGEDPYGQDRGGSYTTGAITLPRGTPLSVALQHREGGGGSRLQPEFSIDGGTTWLRFTPGDIAGVATLTTTYTPSPNLVKTGSGTATLTGNNSYVGTTTVEAGTLVAGHNNALGTADAGTTVASGATLALQGGVTITGEAVTLGAAPGNPATLRNLAGSNTLAGPVSVNPGDTGEVHVVSASAGESLTVAGSFDLQQSSLRVAGPGNTTIRGSISGQDYYEASFTDTLEAAAPIAWWKFEETGITPGTTTAANSGSLGTTADGTYTGTGMTTQAGLYGNAVEIQRTDNRYVDTVSADTLSMKEHAFTALAWFQRDETGSGDRMIFGTPASTDSEGMHMGLRDGQPYMGFYGNDLGAGPDVSDTEWHLIVFRFDDGGDPADTGSNQQAVFLDGELQGTRSNDLAFLSSDVLRLGTRSGDGNAFSGLLDEIAIFDRALSEAEIRQLYEVRDGRGWIYADNDLVKEGTGTLTLSGDNTYNGTTEVLEGMLVLNGTHTGGGMYHVAAGATLGGYGSTDAPVTLGGAVSPGRSVGTLTTGSETWTSGGSYTFQIDDADGTMGAEGGPGWDLLEINGTLDLTGLQTGQFEVDLVTLLPGGGTNPGPADFSAEALVFYAWDFVHATDGIQGFEETDFVLDLSGFANDITNEFGTGRFGIRANPNDPSHYLQITFTSAVPEPSACVLAGLGLLGLGLYALRRRRQVA